VTDAFTGSPGTDRGNVTDLRKGGSVNIYVGNLSFEITEDELRREFAEFGEVTSVIIMDDKYIGSGQTRGYGYVEMACKSEGADAIAGLEGKKLRDRVVTVVAALPLSDKNGLLSPNTRNSHRPNKKRERRYTNS